MARKGVKISPNKIVSMLLFMQLLFLYDSLRPTYVYTVEQWRIRREGCCYRFEKCVLEFIFLLCLFSSVAGLGRNEIWLFIRFFLRVSGFGSTTQYNNTHRVARNFVYWFDREDVSDFFFSKYFCGFLP